MQLSKHPVIKGCFILRENRFIASVQLENGTIVSAHVPNTGRMKELLVRDASVLLSYDPAPNRKTDYTLIAVMYNGIWVSIHAVLANAVAENWLREQAGVSEVKREVRYGDSRFDLGCTIDGRKAFYEVKSVNLVVDGTALFPDAPTTRGVKHLIELIKARQENYHTGIIFVIMRSDAERFEPNTMTDPDFAKWLSICKENQIETHALRCVLTESTIGIEREIPIVL